VGRGDPGKLPPRPGKQFLKLKKNSGGFSQQVFTRF
jgi:hypothetical protein